MRALRFCLLGHGISAIAGFCAGIYFGYLTGWLTAWLGGGVLSVLFAYAWFRAREAGFFRKGIADGAATRQPVTPRDHPRLAKIWDRDLVDGTAELQPGGPARLPARAEHARSSGPRWASASVSPGRISR